MRTYKTVMHFNKLGSRNGTPWTVHFRGTCFLVAEIQCHVPMVSEWKPDRKTNPRAFFTAQVSSLTITSDKIAILK